MQGSKIFFVLFYLLLSNILFRSNISAQILIGRTVDANSYEPVRDAFIYLMSSSKTISGIQVSDSLGNFSFHNFGFRKFYVKIKRMGFNETFVGKLTIPSRDTLAITFELEPAPYQLPDITVKADVPTTSYDLEEVGFYKRKSLGWGKFFIREENFKTRKFASAAELLYGIAGVKMIRNVPYSTRGGGMWNVEEPMLIYIDGALIDIYDEYSPFLNLLSPASIKALEVYPTATHAPIQYTRGLHRGVILIWTGE